MKNNVLLKNIVMSFLNNGPSSILIYTSSLILNENQNISMFFYCLYALYELLVCYTVCFILIYGGKMLPLLLIIW